MKLESILEQERKSLDKIRKLQLPSSFKRIGIIVAVLSFLLLFVNKWTVDTFAFRIACKYGMLIGLLVVSISKEEIEDEFIRQLRMQSYTFAFIAAVVMMLIQPIVNFAVDYAISGESVFKENGDFVILWMLLVVQVCYFELLKKTH